MAPPDRPATVMPARRSTARVAIAIVAAIAGIAVTASLGFWQLRRAAERTAIAQAWEAARNESPRWIRNESDVEAIAASVPRRVRLRGEFDSAHTWWLDNRTLGGRAGFLVVTPFRAAGVDKSVLVLRGWAPRDPADRLRLPPIRPPAGMVDIEGLAVADVPRVYELGAAGSGPIRQNMGRREASNELGVAVAPFVVQQFYPLDDGLDRAWPAPAGGAERNRGYAFQWFALSALITVLLLVFGPRALRARASMGRVA